MFWGFPVSVATLPTLAAVASAIRYGTGGSPSWRVAPSTTGARTRQTTSFTKKAERTPEATMTAASRPRRQRRRSPDSTRRRPYSKHTCAGAARPAKAIQRAVAKDVEDLSEEARVAEIRGRIKTLTPRETEVFALVVTGMLNKQIASA